MIIKGMIDECFGDYKVPAMYIACPKCSFKCDKESGSMICQNSRLAAGPTLNIDIDYLIERYLNNPITEAIVFSGLEPFDTSKELLEAAKSFRQKTKDTIIIYTGYTEEELKSNPDFQQITKIENIIIKFGRFVPNCESHYEEVLGISLASPNQYAKFYGEDI